MPVFQYKAVNADQEIVSGLIDSDSPRQARTELRKLGLRVTNMNGGTDAISKPRFAIGNLFAGGWDSWTAGFVGELATLLSVDVPLTDALQTLHQQHSAGRAEVILKLKDSVSAGQSLASAMHQQPNIFDSLCQKMVQVGEQTGKLDSVLRQVADFKRRSAAFKDRVLSALLYPLILLSVSVGVSVFLMTVVVPTLLENLKDSGRPLPWPTLILKFTSELLSNYGLFLLLAVGAVSLAAWLMLKTKQGRLFRDRLILKIPVLGQMSRQQEISRVALVIATLLKSGIKFVPALRITIGTSKNELLSEALNQCAQDVETGRDIGVALKKCEYFPPLVTQIFTIGQESGKMESMLMQLSEDYDRQVETLSGRISTIIEPVLILTLSIFIGFIMFATLMPILEAGNVL